MTASHDRRGFLRGLVSLPLIGGGLTLIGAPSAVAEPITTAMLRQYVGFLGREFGEAHDELLRRDPSLMEPKSVLSAVRGFVGDKHLFHTFADPTTDAIVDATPPSTRAALVLSTVGCNWRNA